MTNYVLLLGVRVVKFRGTRPCLELITATEEQRQGYRAASSAAIRRQIRVPGVGTVGEAIVMALNQGELPRHNFVRELEGDLYFGLVLGRDKALHRVAMPAYAAISDSKAYRLRHKEIIRASKRLYSDLDVGTDLRHIARVVHLLVEQQQSVIMLLKEE